MTNASAAAGDAALVRLLILDVDGVMTDGGIHLDDRGVETKRFHVRDGTAIKLWIKLGHDVAIITGRGGEVVKHRARELGIRHVIQGTTNKGDSLRRLLSDCRIDVAHTAALADDLPELPLLKLVGYPMAVADAACEIHELARYITTRPGGHAAVREAIEHLLRARGEWERALAHFGNKTHG